MPSYAVVDRLVDCHEVSCGLVASRSSDRRARGRFRGRLSRPTSGLPAGWIGADQHGLVRKIR